MAKPGVRNEEVIVQMGFQAIGLDGVTRRARKGKGGEPDGGQGRKVRAEAVVLGAT